MCKREREGDRDGGYAMAERNPLGADASLSSGGLPSPATNASLSGPWAFLVQNAETGVRQQLRVDADAGEWVAKRSDLSETERERGGGRRRARAWTAARLPPPCRPGGLTHSS